MLTIDLEGAKQLLALLQRIRTGHAPTDGEIAAVMDANAFFFDFYSHWVSGDRAVLAEVIRSFDQPDRLSTDILKRMAGGFRRAVDETATVAERLTWFDEVDTEAVIERVRALLPDDTLLESTVHITVDDLNNAFMYEGDMGASVIRMDSRATFEAAAAHELHHAGVRYWRQQDPVHQTLEGESSGRAVALAHVENLLSEGLANFYLTPQYALRADPDAPVGDAFQARLNRLHREELDFFAKAEHVLAVSLAPDADTTASREAYGAIAMDMEDFMLPAGHYLGARMVQTMDEVLPRDKIIECVVDLPAFLPRYNEAARRIGAFVFDDTLVDRFGLLCQETRTELENAS